MNEETIMNRANVKGCKKIASKDIETECINIFCGGYSCRNCYYRQLALKTKQIKTAKSALSEILKSTLSYQLNYQIAKKALQQIEEMENI